MDLFRFIPGEDPSFLVNGQSLNKIKTAQWTERYVDPGEFEITAGVSSGLRELLPPGTMISHTDTHEVMLVETVNLKEDTTDSGGEPQLTIRGRSLEYWFRQRITGGDIETYVIFGERLMVTVSEYALAMDTSWEQVKTMLEAHVTVGPFANDGEGVDGWAIISNQQHIGSTTSQARVMRKQNLHSSLLELLAVDDFGIKVVRPNPANVDPTKTEFRIHNGVDRTEDVIFSHTFGDLEKPEYLWSDGALKTDFFCRSNFFEMRSAEGGEGFNRRLLYVDCTDLDEHMDIEDANAAAAEIGAAMDVRGQQALRSQVATNLLATDISKRSRYKFKTHYDVGDIVSVHGNYDEQSIMRVVEHVSFLDEKGETGYPTLAAVNE